MTSLLRTSLPALALALGLAAPVLPAAAQSLADLRAGPMGACLADHFDVQRYQQDLAAAGWVPLPDAARSAVVPLLALAFLPLTHAAPAGQSADIEGRRAAAEALWTQELAERAALVQGDSVLFLRGHVQSDGFRRVDCWLVTPDGGFVNGLIAQSAEPVAEGAEVAVILGPMGLTEISEVLIRASRYPDSPGPVWGISTVTLIEPAAP